MTLHTGLTCPVCKDDITDIPYYCNGARLCSDMCAAVWQEVSKSSDTHTPCTSEYCETCQPVLARINQELASVAAQLQVAGGEEWQALDRRYSDLLDHRWAAMPASGLYSEVN